MRKFVRLFAPHGFCCFECVLKKGICESFAPWAVLLPCLYFIQSTSIICEHLPVFVSSIKRTLTYWQQRSSSRQKSSQGYSPKHNLRWVPMVCWPVILLWITTQSPHRCHTRKTCMAKLTNQYEVWCKKHILSSPTNDDLTPSFGRIKQSFISCYHLYWIPPLAHLKQWRHHNNEWRSWKTWAFASSSLHYAFHKSPAESTIRK